MASEFGLVTSAFTVILSDLSAGSVARLVFNRSRGAGDSPSLVLRGEFGGNDGERSGLEGGLAEGETESDSFSTGSGVGLSSSSSPEIKVKLNLVPIQKEMQCNV